MIVVDLLLALNGLLLGVCVFRGTSRNRAGRSAAAFTFLPPSNAEARTTSRQSGGTIIPLHRASSRSSVSRSVAMHPSTQDRIPGQ